MLTKTVKTNQSHILKIVSGLGYLISKNRLVSTILGLSGFTLIRYGYIRLYRKVYKLPNGPIGLPFLGIMPALVINIITKRKYLNKYGNTRHFSKYYGNIMSFWLNKDLTIVISDSKLCHMLLKNKLTVDRPDTFRGWGIFSDPYKKASSFVSLNDKDWVYRRKYAQSALSKVSTNKFLDMVIGDAMNDTIFPVFDKIINGDINIIGNEDDKDNKELWYSRKLLSYIAFRTIFHSNFGHKIGYSDKLHKEMMSITADGVDPKALSKLMFLNVFKITRYLPFMTKQYFDWVDRRNKCINKIINKRLNSKEYNPDKPVSYIDYIIKLVKEGELTKNEMILDVYLFFLAGSETTSNNLEWGIIYLCKDIDIQNKVRNELMNVFKEVDDNGIRQFKLSKWNECPLHRALVFEILRIATVIPEGVQHKVKKDIKIEYNGKKYIIPKGTTIQYNESTIHKESLTENWKYIDSDNLHLDNWLIKDNKTNKYKFIHNDSHVTFGLGRRDCIGKHLAIKEMASVLGYMLLNYKFTFDDDNNKTIVSSEVGFNKIKHQIGIKIEKI